MENLEFKKGKRLNKNGEPVIWSNDRGYYFKGEFISKYKNNAFDIIRDRIEKAGNGDFFKGKEILKDESELLFDRMNKFRISLEKTRIKKKPFYIQQRISGKKRTIDNLKKEIILEKEKLKQLKKEYRAKLK